MGGVSGAGASPGGGACPLRVVDAGDPAGWGFAARCGDVALVRVVDEGGPARAVYAATVRGRAVPAAGEAFVEVLAETARAMAWTTPGTG
nr:hypothetical protein [Streptomyces sp. ST1020]